LILKIALTDILKQLTCEVNYANIDLLTAALITTTVTLFDTQTTTKFRTTAITLLTTPARSTAFTNSIAPRAINPLFNLPTPAITTVNTITYTRFTIITKTV